MDALAAEQKELAEKIKTLHQNYKKDGPSRKTQPYFQKRKRELGLLWEQFELRHASCLALEKIEITHPYFVSNYYKQARELYNEYHAALIQGESNLEEPEATEKEDSRERIEQQTSRMRKQEAKIELFRHNLNNLDFETAHSKAYFQQKLKVLENYWKAITANHDELIMYDDKYLSSNQYMELETEYQEKMVELQERYDDLYADKGDHQAAKNIKLPPLNITPFDGNYKNWPSFAELFKEVIHKNNAIGRSQKMHYLKTSLHGNARKLIQHLQISEENYETAWDLLCNRYNNKRLLVNSQLQGLLTQPQMSTESANALKTLHDTTRESLHAIKNIGVDVDSWDPILVYILSQKLDPDSRRQYEEKILQPKEMQTLKAFLEFVESKFQSLEAISDNQRNSQGKPNKNQNYRNFIATKTLSCVICKGDHAIYLCQKYNNMNIKQKMDTVQREKLCTNCLSYNHNLAQCKTFKTCRICRKRHHTSLHSEEKQQASQRAVAHSKVLQNQQNSDQPTPSTSTIPVQSLHSKDDGTVLLATALINVTAQKGNTILLRALIDQGSQTSFITEDAAQKLRAPRTKIHAKINGVGASLAGVSKSSVKITLNSCQSGFNITISAMVLKRLTKMLPDESIRKKWSHLQHLVLADPNFYEPGSIDLILGADVYAMIILDGVVKGRKEMPIAQQTEFGWIISGGTACNTNEISCNISRTTIEKDLERFWELEEIPASKTLTKEEEECEKKFEQFHKRLPSGRYEVKLPFKFDSPTLGFSRQCAVARLIQMEKKFAKNQAFYKEYKRFIQEYQELGHMIPVTTNRSPEQTYYLPHHAVLKKDSVTTKLRVVFDASSKTSNGNSLNDILLTGPTLQDELLSIILRWQQHKVVFTADIEKMYRQIRISEEDQGFQRILWRENSNHPIQEFQLTTVTYGTTSGSFLAVRSLQQLGRDEQHVSPAASKIILTDFYVDDLLSGANTLQEASKLKKELKETLLRGGFNLRKWNSNEPTLSESEMLQENLTLYPEGTVKTLGLLWSPRTDCFLFKINLPEAPKATKRNILSESARIFDPLGWLAPVTILAKIAFQHLWTIGVSWDEEIPVEAAKQWYKFRNELPSIQSLQLPRWNGYDGEDEHLELHGFCDASEKAYAAAIYSRTKNAKGENYVKLLTAKTKVAPIKNQRSIPQLELCGAVLLSKLMKHTLEALKNPNIQISLWTDSKIVLAWLNKSPNRWETFIANRVSQIIAVTDTTQWHHVPGIENPADYATRGIAPSELKDTKTWWYGPDWLSHKHIQSSTCEIPDTLLGRKKTYCLTSTVEFDEIQKILNKHSSLSKAMRVLAYCYRFIHAIRNKKKCELGPLRNEELKNALTMLIRSTQRNAFPRAIGELAKEKKIGNESNLLSLTPFLDSQGILRVGGRIENANLSYDKKHPIILPYDSQLTRLVINLAHKNTLHGGNTLTLAHIRNQYWIIHGLRAVKKQIHKCLICFRHNAELRTQLMGNLPEPRVTSSKPFNHSGVDYAGPIDLRISKGRGNRSYKGYICIFICLSTKAIHLEAVSDLTSQAFIAAYKRFSARRGIPRHIYSDNGTNFVGANKILQMAEKNQRIQYNKEICDSLTEVGTEWHFIPPSSPHFGGLWEAGVRSMKYHMKRTIGDHKLTYEEMCTLLAQIEACLNSRPLCALSQDPGDLNFLTPGHFLVGTSLQAPPEADRLNQNHLQRWHLLERMHQEFWRKWKAEYIPRLQQRSKWRSQESNIKPGELVIIKEDNLPPTKWSLGRVIDTHPGSDGLTRVVTIKTASTTMKRPITKIASLPISDNFPETGEKTQIQNKQKPQTNEIAKRTSKQIYLSTTQELIKESRKLANRKPKRRKINPTSIPVRPPIEDLKAYNKRKRNEKSNSLMTIILAILSLLQLLTTTVSQEITITNFKNHPGIFFEDLGRIDLTNNMWNIIAYYDLTNYWSELIGFRNIVQRTESSCLTLNNEQQFNCKAILEQFKTRLKQMEHNNDILHARNGNFHKFSRRRRGLFNFVGNIAHTLFGVLDENYAKQHEEKIIKLKGNQNYLLELFKKQTSITESTQNILKKDEQNIEKQFEVIGDHLTKLTNASKEIHDDLNIQRQAQERSSLFLYIIILMSNYEKIQTALIDVIMDVHHGKISPLLLTPEQLNEQIKQIRNNIPSSLRVPGDSTAVEDLLRIYHILTVKTRITSNNIVFDIKLPLTLNEHWQLFKVISVPTPHDNEFIYIQPSTDYLAVSLDRERHYPLSSNELHRCKILMDERHLCKQQHPIHNRLADANLCEISLLHHEKALSSTCQLKSIAPTQVWIQLHNPNTWIFVLDQEYTFNIVCGDKIIEKTLRGDGQLHLKPNCILKQKTMTINAHNINTSRLNGSFLPISNLTKQLQQNNVQGKPIQLTQPKIFFKANQRALESLDGKIRDIHLQQEMPNNITHHDIHQYVVLYLIATSLLAIIMYYIIKRLWITKRSEDLSTSRFILSDFQLDNRPGREHVQTCTDSSCGQSPIDHTEMHRST